MGTLVVHHVPIVENEDRRLHRRLKVRKLVSVRASDGSAKEETATMTDLSRDGVYFTVRSAGYQIGMDVQLQIPGSFQCVCNIVRIERLPNRMLGVGALIIRW
jgi:PilZ domain